MLLPEQLVRFHEFRKSSLRLEFSEHRNEHPGYRSRSAICVVQARKFKRAAQLESPGLLVSRDFQRSLEGVFGTGYVRRVMAR